jgi:predicted MFS family arabinose efflux permease
VFGLAAGLATIAAVAVLFGFRGSRGPAGRFSVAVAVGRYARLLAMPRGRALFLLVFFEGAIIFGVQPYLAPMLEAGGLGGAAEAGLIIASFAIGGILYTLNVRGLLRVLGLRRMLLASGVFAAGAFLVLAPAPVWQVQAAALFAMGIGFYMLHNSLQTQVTELAADSRASAVSIHAFSYFMGQAIGTPLFGLGLVTIGATAALVSCAAGILLLGLLAASVLGRPQPRAL